MFQTIRNAFKNPDLRKRIIFTFIILVIFRFGCAVLVPFADASVMQNLLKDQNSLFGFLSAFSGGAFEKATVFSLSIQPYITASIIIQLLSIAIPALERLSKEGEVGRKK
ncbi:MAG: preprotein translocase subunit SecY, partial [Oscillospiraceae bacterium]